MAERGNQRTVADTLTLYIHILEPSVKVIYNRNLGQH